jgi:macrodomain Ter protein organizer (MatP/YcbG family)
MREKKKKKKKNCIIDFMCWPKLQMTPYRIKINSEITVVGLIYKSFMDSNFVKIFDRFC